MIKVIRIVGLKLARGCLAVNVRINDVISLSYDIGSRGIGEGIVKILDSGRYGLRLITGESTVSAVRLESGNRNGRKKSSVGIPVKNLVSITDSPLFSHSRADNNVNHAASSGVACACADEFRAVEGYISIGNQFAAANYVQRIKNNGTALEIGSKGIFNGLVTTPTSGAKRIARDDLAILEVSSSLASASAYYEVNACVTMSLGVEVTVNSRNDVAEAEIAGNSLNLKILKFLQLVNTSVEAILLSLGAINSTKFVQP